MEEEEGTSHASGKLGKAVAKGGAGACDVKQTPSWTEQELSSLVNQRNQNLHPVKLKTNMRLEVPPLETVELRGDLQGATDSCRVLPRNRDWLPENIQVTSATVTDQQVTVCLRNTSSRRSALVTADDILAELHFQDRVEGRVEALVGPSCVTAVWVNGSQTKCLIDSGSQVTVISESFFKNVLKDTPLERLDTTLNIKGAGGQTVPYLGVIRVTVQLPEEVVGTSSAHETLAVVCPDTRFLETVPVIVGTNTLRLMAKSCERQGGRYWSTTLPIRCEVAFAYSDISTGTSGRLCPVRLVGRDVVVLPHSTTEVRGVVRHGVPTTRGHVLVQEPSIDRLPEGLLVLSGRTSTHNLPRVKVALVNPTDSPIKIKARNVIADLFAIQAEYDLPNIIKDLKSQEPALADDSAGNEQSRLSPERGAGLASRFRFGEDVDPGWKEQFTERLLDYSDVFSQSEFDIGQVNIKHDIELEPGPPIRDRPRPIPPQDLEEVRQHIQSLLDAHIIRPSTSPFASPIVLVRKRSGALRMCVDYRKVNARTIRDSYALPKIEDLFMTLSGAKYFTSMDLSKAYYQVPLSERAKKISAFTTPFGLFEFERLSFGLVNAPMTFQRLMEQCLSDMNLAELIIFLDDILVHAPTLDLLEQRTVSVLQRMRRYGLKLDPDKCVFCVKEVRHLGFLISADGIRPDPTKTEALTQWPLPRTVKDVKSFIGFAGYYRRWVPHFSQIVKPLNDLTAGYIPRKTQQKGGKKGTLNLSSDISHLWEEKHQQAFGKVIHLLTSEPIIGIADRNKPFTLHCDASGQGLGAVLYQEQDGKTKVIAYASRGLNKTEMNYPAHKREFLALKWAMTNSMTTSSGQRSPSSPTTIHCATF